MQIKVLMLKASDKSFNHILALFVHYFFTDTIVCWMKCAQIMGHSTQIIQDPNLTCFRSKNLAYKSKFTHCHGVPF